ncbi:hypothetical protein SDC9_68893 [bioreactor metagenome]|uniref:Uncharacterized protein n=1 Tax=bioreactor metagenome TaxID=1076179 RepID=A0A644Y364_9ZZZZ
MMYFDFVYGIYVDTREKTNRESARIPQAFGLLPESDLLILTLTSQLRCLARPFIGIVRANPVAAPAAPNCNSSLRLILRLPEKNNYLICNDQ